MSSHASLPPEGYVGDTTDILYQRVIALEKQVALLMRGGCVCEKPEWYYANLLSFYRCSRCDAVLSSRLMPEKEAAT